MEGLSGSAALASSQLNAEGPRHKFCPSLQLSQARFEATASNDCFHIPSKLNCNYLGGKFSENLPQGNRIERVVKNLSKNPHRYDSCYKKKYLNLILQHIQEYRLFSSSAGSGMAMGLLSSGARDEINDNESPLTTSAVRRFGGWLP